MLHTKFHPYLVYSSQLIPFLRTIITFPGKRLLISKGAAGWVLLKRFFFRCWCLVSIAAINQKGPSHYFASIAFFWSKGWFFWVRVTSGPTVRFGSKFKTWCNLSLPMIYQSFGPLCSVVAAKWLPEVALGLFTQGTTPEVGVQRSLGF